MAKYTKEIEAVKFEISKEQLKELVENKFAVVLFENSKVKRFDENSYLAEFIVSGASEVAYEGDYLIYDKGQIVSIVKADKFEADHKPVAEEEAKKPSKK